MFGGLSCGSVLPGHGARRRRAAGWLEAGVMAVIHAGAGRPLSPCTVQRLVGGPWRLKLACATMVTILS